MNMIMREDERMKFLPTADVRRIEVRRQTVTMHPEFPRVKERVGQEAASEFHDRYGAYPPQEWITYNVDHDFDAGLTTIRARAVPPSTSATVIVEGETRQVEPPANSQTVFDVARRELTGGLTRAAEMTAMHTGWDLDTGHMVFEVTS